MAITQRMLKKILETEIHPFVVSSTLYDRHVENRLDMLTDVEKAFKDQYRHRLFLHVDVESHVVTYEIGDLGISVQYSWA